MRKRTANAHSFQQRSLSRALRRTMTPAEATLWEQLRGRRLAGLKFRRQHPIGTFVVDFYCVEAGLVVEVDGPIHDYTRDEDRRREDFLREQNVRILRLTNDEITHRIDLALEKISAAASA
jgi:very-short-patch-repair endonuclease